MTLPPLPPTYDDSRSAVQRVAVHVLARARSQSVGKIGLVPTPGGIGTPAFGAAATVLRLTATSLVVDHDGEATVVPLWGTSLQGLADAAGADLAADFSAGSDTPPVGDVAAPIVGDPSSVTAIGAWLARGWAAMDVAVAAIGAAGSPARTQVWPEHFDAGTSVAFGPGESDRANLGASPGDGFHAEPYLYVGPWGPERPGDEAYWNAPFGAVLGYADLASADDPVAIGAAFLLAGLRHLGAPVPPAGPAGG